MQCGILDVQTHPPLTHCDSRRCCYRGGARGCCRSRSTTPTRALRPACGRALGVLSGLHGRHRSRRRSRVRGRWLRGSGGGPLFLQSASGWGRGCGSRCCCILRGHVMHRHRGLRSGVKEPLPSPDASQKQQSDTRPENLFRHMPYAFYYGIIHRQQLLYRCIQTGNRPVPPLSSCYQGNRAARSHRLVPARLDS